MRLFTAIDIPIEIKARLQEFVNRLKPAARLAWSPVENLHITTKFIGEWPPSRLDELQNVLASVEWAGPIRIAVRDVGWFPNPRNPRVLFAGIEAGEPLPLLARATDQALAKLGVPAEEREFHPHLTLARRRDGAPLDELRRLFERTASSEFGSFVADSYILYQSAGGRYTKLRYYPLNRI